MVTYSYTVSADGPTYTIQEAINRVASELSLSPTIERDIIINVADGVYGGFVIPDGALSTLVGSAYRLVVQAAGNFMPVIDFNVSENISVGIDIGTNNPNFSVKGFRVQYFPVGIRAGLNSHYPLITNNTVVNNRNVGIFIEQCHQAQILQNVVVNGDYGIVVRLCKSAAIIHNTIFQNGAIASKKGASVSGIWANLAMNYGNGVSDTGYLHIIGNLVWNICGQAVTLFVDDVERQQALVSNYNDFFSGDPTKLIVLEDRRFYYGAGSAPRRVFANLSEWKALGFDTQSISVNPGFIAPTRIRSDRNGYALDLTLLTTSPILGIVPSFFVDAGATSTWLPSYVDSQSFAKDILGSPRVQVGTAIGANDRATNTGFYGSDIFSNPLDINITKNCDVNPISDVMSNRLDIWYPTLKRGFFYSNEREYYLYSKKECKNLGELAVSKFRLPSKVATAYPITVRVNGTELSSSCVDIVGDDLYVYHSDSNIVHGNEEVDITYYMALWSNGGYMYQQTHIVFKVWQGKISYYLPTGYIPVGPVIVTDDMSCPTDSDYISHREYTIKFDEVEQKTELIFANDSNQLINGQFDYHESFAPFGWESNLATIRTGASPTWTVAGYYECEIAPSGFIAQTVRSNELSVLSLFARGNTIGYNLHAYDSRYMDLGYVLTGSIQLSDTWNRYYVVLGTTTPIETGYIPTNLGIPILVDRLYIPQETSYLSIKFTNPSSQSAYVDALQFEEGEHLTAYHRRPFLNELTVEYETSTEDHFVDTKQSICPVRNYITDGFMYIPEITARTYGGPTANAITTLNEYTWPYGRKNILPWARTKGKDKLCYRPGGAFHSEPQLKPEIITPVFFGPIIDTVELYPSTPVGLQGDTNGVGFSISVTDRDSNPVGLSYIVAGIVDKTAQFPGFLFKKLYGLKEQLSQVIYTNLDNAGIVNLVWIPPDESKSTVHVSVPLPIDSAGTMSQIKVKYPVSLKANGNITIQDSTGKFISTVGNRITDIYYATVSSTISQFSLPYSVSYGSMTVVVDNKTYTESFSSSLESNQFYVDYDNSKVIINGRHDSATISYVPVYVTATKSDPRTIVIRHDKVFSSVAKDERLLINYDYSVPLTVSVFDNTLNTYYTTNFELIARNYKSIDNRTVNTLGLEI